MNAVLVQCSRCKRTIEGIRDEICTGGFYDTSIGDWKKFADNDEDIICDDCMFIDGRYQKVYGKYISEFSLFIGFAEQWKTFLEYYPDATYTPNPKANNTHHDHIWQTLISYTETQVPKQWGVEKINVRFSTSIGYPVARPELFWTDRLSVNGHLPMYSWIGRDPLGNEGLIFRARWSKWNPNHDSLITLARQFRLFRLSDYR